MEVISMGNCLDECWNLSDTNVLCETLVCKKMNKTVDPDAIGECSDFRYIESCPNCVNHTVTVYDCTGSIGYNCKLQNGKEIFQDVTPLRCNYSDVPKCPINSFKRE